MLLLIDYQPLPFIQACVTAAIGVYLLAVGTIGFYRAEVHTILRILAIGGALCLLIPGTVTDLVGLTILGAIYFIQVAKAKRAGTNAPMV